MREGIRGKTVVIAVTALFAVFVICGIRGAQRNPGLSAQEVVGNSLDNGSETADTTEQSADTAEEEGDPIITVVMNGDVETLVGIRFGEPLDGELFEEVYDGEYCRTDVDDGWTYYFNAEGNRFDSMSSSYEGIFLGMELMVDTEETVKAMFGEPDETEMRRVGHTKYTSWTWYTYHFPMADMELTFRDGTLTNRIWYRATSEALAQNPLIETGPTDFQTAVTEGCDMAEIIYQWRGQGDDVNYTVPNNEGYDESQVEKFVEDYLHEQGMEQEQRAGEIYDQDGNPFFVYYFDETQERYCFVMYRLYRFGWNVCCGIRNIADANMAGSLTCSVDESTGIVTETQYDRWGRDRIAEVSFCEEEGFPFPVIVDSWEEDDGSFLCRDKYMWFYEDAIVYDGNGRIESYQGDENHGDDCRFWYPSDFSYDADGRLIDIVTEAGETDYEYTEFGRDQRAHMYFEYDGDGALMEADYWFSEWSYGTYDRSGSIWYDSQGRMIYHTYYVTHGCHHVFYLYEDGEERPWAIASWCDQEGFGLELFEPVE